MTLSYKLDYNQPVSYSNTIFFKANDKSIHCCVSKKYATMYNI